MSKSFLHLLEAQANRAKKEKRKYNKEGTRGSLGRKAERNAVQKRSVATRE